MQFYIFVMFLGLPDDIHEEKPSSLQSEKKTHYRRTDGPTDGRTDGRTDERTDGRTDGRTNGHMDRWTNVRTNRRTDRHSNRDVRRHIKKVGACTLIRGCALIRDYIKTFEK